MLTFRMAQAFDVDRYYQWANDPLVRSHSYQSDPIPYQRHVEWFQKVLSAENYFLYIFMTVSGEPVGQVRIEHKGDHGLLGVSIDADHRGKGYSSEMIDLATRDFQAKKNIPVHAWVFKTNEASARSFLSASFIKNAEVVHQGIPSYLFIKQP